MEQFGLQCSNASKTSKRYSRMANSVDPDQIAPLGGMCSAFTLLAQSYMSTLYM